MLQWEETIKGEHELSLKAAVTVIWVFQHKRLGLSTSHRPSTSAVWVPLELEA